MDLRFLSEDTLKRVNEMLHLEVEVEVVTRDKRGEQIAVLPSVNLGRILLRLKAYGQVPASMEASLAGILGLVMSYDVQST